jgi:hypothetical protein
MSGAKLTSTLYIPGAFIYRGGYDAATNTPDLDTTPSGIKRGDSYTVTVAGNFFTIAVEIGDLLIAEIDNPTLEANWTIVNRDLDDASIKVAYENNADTNAYTDADLATVAATSGSNTGDEVTATDALEGIVELSTVGEADTGTDVSRVMSVDVFAGSDFGTKHLSLEPFDGASVVSTGDGTNAVSIPASLDGYDLVNVVATVEDKGVTGTTDVVIRRWRAGAAADMTSTAITIGDEWFAQDGTIDTANDDVITGDRIYADVDTVHSGTAPNGLGIVLEFRKP